MRVLEVQDCFYPSVDGPIEVMNSLARTFNKKGYGEVELLVPRYPQKVEVDGLKIHRCKSVATRGGYRAALPFLDGKVKKLIKHGNFDIIHLHSPFPLAKCAEKLGKRYGIPVVITVHTKFRDEVYNLVKTKGLRNFVMNYLLKCIDGCDGIVSVCRGMKDTLKEYGSKRVEDVKVIYNGTSMPLGEADGANVEKIRSEYGLDGKVAFIFAGRLVEAKNVQFSLKALAEVKKRGFDNFKFLIVGEGIYGKTLNKLAEKYNLKENVVFVGKITDRRVLAEYYAAADLLLFPSVFDNASIVLLEAAANGLPAATVAGSCSAERIEDGVNGFAWDYDENVWADKIAGLLGDTAALKAASDGAKEKFYVGWDEITEEYYNYYKEIIAAYSHRKNKKKK